MDIDVLLLTVGSMLLWTIYEGSLENVLQTMIFQYLSFLGYPVMCFFVIKYILGNISNNSLGRWFLHYIKIFEDLFKNYANLENVQRNQNNFLVESTQINRHQKQVRKIKILCKADEFQNNSKIRKFDKEKLVKNTNILNKKENFQIGIHCENKEFINKRQKEDIDILRTVIRNIENVEVGKYDIKQTIISIGQLMRKLSYDFKDSENICIRNKYGFIRRNKGKQINKNGIYFEKIVNLQMVLENNSHNISNIDFNELKLDLINLKVEIKYIIKREESNENKEPRIENDPLSMSTILKIARKYYPILIFGKMKVKLMELEEIDFSCKDDRYNFAHVFICIGECANEIKEDPVLNEQFMNISESLKTLTRIRHNLIHRQSKLIKNGNAEKYFPNEKVQVILKYFSEFIDNNYNINNFNQLQFDGNINEATKSIKTFLDKSKESIQSINNTTRLIDIQKVISNSKPHVISALKLFENERLNENQKKLKLKKLNEKYQNSIKSIQSEIDKIGLPKIINLSNKNNIVRYAEELERDNLFTRQHVNVSSIKSNGISNDILEEFEYYKYVESNSNLSSIKQQNIISYILTTIGQYFRDLNAKCNLKPSKLITQANSAAIRSRNEGLAHNPLSLNQSILFQRFKDDIMPAKNHFEAFLLIKNNDVSSNDLAVEIGQSFITLGDFNSAIKVFNSAIKDLIENDDLGFHYAYLLGNLAYVYKLCERFVDSYEIYEKLFVCFQDLDPAKIPDERKEYYGVQYQRIAHSRAMFCQFKEALECCYKGEMIFKNVDSKISQAFYLSNDGQNKAAWDLVQNIENMNMNPTEKCEILSLKASLIKKVLNSDDMVESSYQCITEIEKIYLDNICFFKERLDDRFTTIDITILILKVEHFILGIECDKSQSYSILDQLIDQYEKIINDNNNLTGMFAFIIKLHLAFCEAFLLLNSKNCLYYFTNALYFYLSGKDFFLKFPQINLNFHNQFDKVCEKIEKYVIKNFVNN